MIVKCTRCKAYVYTRVIDSDVISGPLPPTTNGKDAMVSNDDNSLINVVLAIGCVLPFALIACYAYIMYRRRLKMVVNIDSKQKKIPNRISANKSVEPGQIEGYVNGNKGEIDAADSSANDDSKLQDVLIEVLRMASNDVQQLSTYSEYKQNVLDDVVDIRMSSNESLYASNQNENGNKTMFREGNEDENLIHKIIMDTRQKTQYNGSV